MVPIVKGVGLKAKGESFGTLVASANKWAAERPELKVVNMQSVNFRMGKAEERELTLTIFALIQF